MGSESGAQIPGRGHTRGLEEVPLNYWESFPISVQ